MSRRSTPTIDLHAHAFVAPAEELARSGAQLGAELAAQVRQQGQASLHHNAALWTKHYARALTDLGTRVTTMDAMRIDVQAVSLSPTQYHYWAAPELADRIVRAANQGLAELCSRQPERLVALATVALQHPSLAVAQLDHAITQLRMRGVQISTRAPNAELSDARFEPFWRRAVELGALVFVHPMGCTLGERLADHYLSNVVGQPTETTVALSQLVFSGVLDRHPTLRICAAHGGGYFPHYLGRADHAFEVRPECRSLRMAPSRYASHLFYDSLVHDRRTLRALIDRVGSSQVVLGSDFPFDMGERDPVGVLEALPDLQPQELAQILGGNAARLLGLETSP